MAAVEFSPLKGQVRSEKHLYQIEKRSSALFGESWFRAVWGPLQMVRHERVDGGYSSAGSMVTVTPLEVNCSR